MNKERLMSIILSPLMTEKSARLSDQPKQKQFAFRVVPDANKIEIKHAVEFIFNVKVADVHTCQVMGKEKFFRGAKGTRRDWKKAYVTLKEGDINFASFVTKDLATKVKTGE